MKRIFPLLCVALFLSAAVCGGQGLPAAALAGSGVAGRQGDNGDGTALVPPAYAEGSGVASPQVEDKSSGLTFGQVIGLLAAAGVVGGGGFAAGKARQVRIEPQPLAVELRRDFLSREEFDHFRAQNNKELRDIHARVDTIAPAVAEVRGELKRIASTQETILNLLLNGKQA